MANLEKVIAKGKPIYVGLDVHKRAWVVYTAPLETETDD